MSVNKVILVGHLGNDPEVRYLNEGRSVANVSLATNEFYTDKSGQKIEQTEWHKLEMWDRLAKFAEQYLKKGALVYVEGKLRTDQWQDKEGVSRSTTRIRVMNLDLLSGTPGNSSSENKPSDTSNQKDHDKSDRQSFEKDDVNDDGLPF